MEPIIFVVIVTLTVILLLALNNIIQKLNAMPLPGKQNETDLTRAAPWINRVGYWLTVFSAVALFPLSLSLLFFPKTGGQWLVWPGVAGILALILAVFFIVAVLTKQCFVHRVNLLRLGQYFYRQTVNPAIRQYGIKTTLILAATLVLVPLVPYILELLTVIAYVVGILVAWRLGWVDAEEEDIHNYFEEMYQCIDDTISYDYYTDNFYGTYPDD